MSPPSALNVFHWSPRRFLFLDACLFLTCGLFLFFSPSIACDILFTNATDGVNWHLMRCVGGQLIGGALVLYRLSNSPHAETHTSCFFMRIMISSLMLLVTLHSKTYILKHFEQHMIQLFIVGNVASIALYVWQVARTNWQIGYILLCKDRHISNCLYQLDGYVSVLIGIAWISFPDWLLHRQVALQLNGSHLFIGRVMGVLFCTSSIISSQSLYWAKPSDRRLTVDARAVMNACILSAQIWSQISYHDVWSGNHWVGITLFSVWSIVTFLYLMVTTEG